MQNRQKKKNKKKNVVDKRAHEMEKTKRDLGRKLRTSRTHKEHDTELCLQQQNNNFRTENRLKSWKASEHVFSFLLKHFILPLLLPRPR